MKPKTHRQKRLKNQLGRSVASTTPTANPAQDECSYCYGIGYHKMSCPTRKVTIVISEVEGFLGYKNGKKFKL